MSTTVVSDEVLASVLDQCIGELTLGILLHYNRFYLFFHNVRLMLAHTVSNKFP